MEYRCYKPPPPLQAHVECFWTLEFQACGLPPEERVLPDGKSELIVHYGDPFERINKLGAFERQERGLFAGQMKSFTLLRPTGNTGIVAARFRPAGAARFFAFSSFESTNQVLDLESAIGKQGRDLVEQILNAPSSPNRVQVLISFLLARLSHGKDDPLLMASVRFIEEGIGEINYRSLAKRIGLSERQLERKFRSRVGISPASLGRILRFQRFLAIARRMPHARLIDAAQACGYYDQSHFIKDFRVFAGMPPSAFLLEPHALSDHFTSHP